MKLDYKMSWNLITKSHEAWLQNIMKLDYKNSKNSSSDLIESFDIILSEIILLKLLSPLSILALQVYREYKKKL